MDNIRRLDLALVDTYAGLSTALISIQKVGPQLVEILSYAQAEASLKRITRVADDLPPKKMLSVISAWHEYIFVAFSGSPEHT